VKWRVCTGTSNPLVAYETSYAKANCLLFFLSNRNFHVYAYIDFSPQNFFPDLFHVSMNYKVTIITVLHDVHEEFKPKKRFRTSGKGKICQTNVAIGMCMEIVIYPKITRSFLKKNGFCSSQCVNKPLQFRLNCRKQKCMDRICVPEAGLISISLGHACIITA
jgi:hypothetical protein